MFSVFALRKMSMDGETAALARIIQKETLIVTNMMLNFDQASLLQAQRIEQAEQKRQPGSAGLRSGRLISAIADVMRHLSGRLGQPLIREGLPVG